MSVALGLINRLICELELDAFGNHFEVEAKSECEEFCKAVTCAGYVHNGDHSGDVGRILSCNPQCVKNNGSYIEVIDESIEHEQHNDLITIMCISDTHNKHEEIDISEWKSLNIDILINCGDFTNTGIYHNICSYDKWIATLKKESIIKESVIIAGNHDITLHKEYYVNGIDYKTDKMSNENIEINNINDIDIFNGKCQTSGSKQFHNQFNTRLLIQQTVETKSDILKLNKNYSETDMYGKYCDLCVNTLRQNSYYLCENRIELFGIKIYGTPYQPYLCNWAFGQARGILSKKRFSKLPNDCDIILTHCPPYLIGDWCSQSNDNVGCKELNKRLKQIKPKFHICGHIHESWGIRQASNKNKDKTWYINASTCNQDCKVKNDKGKMFHPPILFKIATKSAVSCKDI